MGLSDKIYIDMIDEQLRGDVQAMLDHELARQARLKAQITQAGYTGWVDEAVLFHHYKQLQFFDTLALYIQTTHREALQEAQFLHVPRTVGDDVTIHARPLMNGVITLSPWCFDVDAFTVFTRGHLMMPLPEGEIPDDPGAYLRAQPASTQAYTFRRA